MCEEEPYCGAGNGGLEILCGAQGSGQLGEGSLHTLQQLSTGLGRGNLCRIHPAALHEFEPVACVGAFDERPA